MQEPKHSVTSVFAVITAAMVNANGRCAVALPGKPLTLNPKNPTSALNRGRRLRIQCLARREGLHLDKEDPSKKDLRPFGA